jgi:hypothetical protein
VPVDDLTIALSVPKTAHGQEITRLVLRKPTSGDLIDLGQPMRLVPGSGTDEAAIDVRMPVVAQYIVRLAAVPMSTVRSLELADLSAATQKVLGFFGGADTAATSSSPTGSSS